VRPDAERHRDLRGNVLCLSPDLVEQPVRNHREAAHVQTVRQRRHITPRITLLVKEAVFVQKAIERGAITRREDYRIECLAAAVAEHDPVFEKVVDARADPDPAFPDRRNRTDVDQRNFAGRCDLCQRTVRRLPETERWQISEQNTEQRGVNRIRNGRRQQARHLCSDDNGHAENITRKHVHRATHGDCGLRAVLMQIERYLGA